MGRYENCAYFSQMYKATQECFPAISTENVHTILREVILAPDDYEIEFNDKVYSKPQVMEMIGQKLIEGCIQVTTEDTYHALIEQSAEIIKHMNDGYIAHQDYEERTDFLETISAYEFSLFAAFSFYKTADVKHESYDEIKLNIIRLREFNDLIQKYTREEQNVESTREEFERALPIYKMLKSLLTLGYDYNFSPRERESLDINHDDDEDLIGNFSYKNWLKRIMLLQLRKEIGIQTLKPALEIANSKTDNVMHKAGIDSQIAQLRGTVKRGFDKDRFIMLEQNQETDATKTKNIS